MSLDVIIERGGRREGQEWVSHVAEAAGAYRLTVRRLQKNATAGSHEIGIEELPVAAGNDRALHGECANLEGQR